MRKIQVPENLVEQFADSGEIPSLVFFAQCKLLHLNNTIYAYTPLKLAQKLQCSVNKVKHHIKVLEDNNLIRHTNNNITFVKIAERHKCTILLNDKDSLKTITYKLYSKLLERNVDRQIWITGKKAEARNKHQVKSLKQLKAINKSINYGILEKPLNTDITLSINSIASILGTSHRTAVNIRKYLHNKGYFKLSTTTDPVKKMSFRAFLYSLDLFPSCYWYKGMVYRPNPSIVTLNKYY